MKKGAIRIGTPILIALFLFPACTRKKAAEAPAPAASQPTPFETPHLALSLPSSAWNCSDAGDIGACHAWDCASAPAHLRIVSRTVSESEDAMDGNFFELKNSCEPVGIADHSGGIADITLGGTDWKYFLSANWPAQGTSSRFYFKRAGKNVMQVQVDLPASKDAELWPQVKSVVESLRLK
jgi:hypothetical protein